MSRFSTDPDPDPTLATRKLKFRSKLDCLRGRMHPPLLFTALAVALMVFRGYGMRETRYCESLFPGTVGKPYFDIDDTRPDAEHPGDEYIEHVLADVKERITRFFKEGLGDPTFEVEQLAIAQRHGVNSKGVFKVVCRCFCSFVEFAACVFRCGVGVWLV